MEQNGQLSPSQTVELLRGIGHSPVKKFGQNFLVDANIVRKSVELAEVCQGDNIVEVGPGLGTLTGALLERGAKVYAVEIDKRLFAFLKERFGGMENLDLINADAVDKPLANLPESAADFKIVANLPYAISTAWLDKVLSGKLPKTMVLMLQKEAALRFAARSGSGDFSPVSIRLAEAYDIPPPHKVSAACFHPRPSVDSMLLLLRRKENPYAFSPRARELMRKIFSTRRKQISSIAKNAGDDSRVIQNWLSANPDIPPSARPEEIENRHWRALGAAARAEESPL